MGFNPFEWLGNEVIKPIGQGLGLIEDPGPAEDLARQYEQNMAMIQAYRPHLARAQAAGLNKQLGAYAPTNEMIKMMYGPQFGLDLNQMGNMDPVLQHLLQGAGGPTAGAQGAGAAPTGEQISGAYQQILSSVPDWARGAVGDAIQQTRAMDPAGMSGGAANDFYVDSLAGAPDWARDALAEAIAKQRGGG